MNHGTRPHTQLLGFWLKNGQFQLFFRIMLNENLEAIEVQASQIQVRFPIKTKLGFGTCYKRRIAISDDEKMQVSLDLLPKS